ncbi:IS6 family transposase [Zooshikella sp. RANM57]|uniref:IS6 family transposase n=1 Tax=Zooshikella sp. RANM57 TaxID=3425863 RepID=UPI003D6E27B5
MISFKGRHFQQSMILQSVRWYVAYPLSYRQIEEMMKERGYDVDHSTIQRWVVHYCPQLEKAFHKKKQQPIGRWRLDETYIKVKGKWKYLYRAADKTGHTIDFLLTAKRDKKAALRFLNKAILRNTKPSLINMDKSGANKAAVNAYNKASHQQIEVRQVKYLNNIVEQDHQGVKRVTRPMLGFQHFHAAQKTLTGIELMHMLKKGQMKKQFRGNLSPAEQFYSLAE